LAINYLSEKVWSSLVDNDSEVIVQLKQVIETLPGIIIQGHPLELTVSQKITDRQVAVETFSIDDIAWLPEQRTALDNGHSVVIFDENETPTFFIKAVEQQYVYQFGPLLQNEQSSVHIIYKWILLLLSYVLLAGVIAFWIRPIWRDLNQLNYMATTIADGDLDLQPTKGSESPINHVVLTFQQMSLRIKRLLDDQKHLVNAVSHELRTPLSRLRFALAMLPEECEDAKTGMETDVKEIESLIDEMLGYARLENLNQPIERKSIDLVSLVQSQLKKLTPVQPIKLNFTAHDPFIFNCNRKLVERALQNLLTNAMRYAKSKVNISIYITESHANILVEDDGFGISKNEFSKVFSPFYRLESETEYHQASSGGGFGLGLAIVKRICDWHAAVCEVEKSDLGGCKFTLSFPIN
jgi:signal transduction histidine kinase